MQNIRSVTDDEWPEAMGLAWHVFLIYEAADYSDEGIRNFYRFVTDRILFRMFKAGQYQLFGYFLDDRLIGIISLREGNHISLLFVDEHYQNRGVASSLLKYVNNYLLTELGMEEVSVDSSPYAVDFYHRMGFVDLDSEVTKNGIRYTPMKFYL